jgi:hypothetical protein
MSLSSASDLKRKVDMMPWEVERRRSSMSDQSRRNSILSVSLFDIAFSPQNPSRSTVDADADPFAPLSIHEGISIPEPQPGQHVSLHPARYSSGYHIAYPSQLLTDRSESSVVSYGMVGPTPSLIQSLNGHIMSPRTEPAQREKSYMSPVKFPATLHSIITPDQSVKSSPFGSRLAEKKRTKALLSKLPLSNDDADEDDEDDDDDELDIDDEDPELRFKAYHEEKWTFRYKELLEYYRQHGHAAVPHTYQKNLQLARWYVSQTSGRA